MKESRKCLYCGSQLLRQVKYCNEECAVELREKMRIIYLPFRKDICEICKISEGEEFKKNRLALLVHHIDENQTNNKIENLVTLCRKCHGKIHS